MSPLLRIAEGITWQEYAPDRSDSKEAGGVGSRRSRSLLEPLSQPSSAAGLAALLALLAPHLAEHAPAIVDLALTAIAIGAAIVAMVKCEYRDCNGR